MDYKIFWCKVNKYYLSKWLNFFNKNWFDDKNWIIISSCVVTDRAKNKFLKDSLKFLKDWKNVYLTWCWAFEKWNVIDYDNFFSIYPEMKIYKDNLFLLSEDPENWTFTFDLVNFEPFKNDFNQLVTEEIYTKKFVVIQNWCDTNCTFCLTIKKRWKSRSRNLQDIITEINEFYNSWWKEIVLTWVNLAAWGANHTRDYSTTKFNDLLEKIITDTKVPRIRISSIWPEFINDKTFDILNNPRFLPHFHISVQSFSNDVLKNMNRNYNNDTLAYVFSMFREKFQCNNSSLSFWADIIVWFPWESDNDFKITCDYINKFGINKLHVFPFSWHYKWDKIPAWMFKNQIWTDIKKIREKSLLELWNMIRNNFINSNLNKSHNVLVEEFKDWFSFWWTSNYIKVKIPWKIQRWEIINIKLTENNLDN